MHVIGSGVGVGTVSRAGSWGVRRVARLAEGGYMHYVYEVKS